MREDDSKLKTFRSMNLRGEKKRRYPISVLRHFSPQTEEKKMKIFFKAKKINKKQNKINGIRYIGIELSDWKTKRGPIFFCCFCF